MKQEIMYNQNSVLIIGLLLASILLAYEICFRLGRYFQRNADQDGGNEKDQVVAVA